MSELYDMLYIKRICSTASFSNVLVLPGDQRRNMCVYISMYMYTHWLLQLGILVRKMEFCPAGIVFYNLSICNFSLKMRLASAR